MSEEVQAAAPAEAVPANPFEAISKKYPNAPTEAQVNTWKQSVPGGRVRFFELPDGKRSLFLRGISALELAEIQTQLVKVAPEKQQAEAAIAWAVKCTLWSSFTVSGRLTDADLRASGAFLPATVQTVILDLSDFVEPSVLDQLVIDF